MALRDRLETAREDYRALPRAHAPEPSEPEHERRRGRFLAVAAVVVLVGGGIGWWSRSDDPATVEAGPATDLSELADMTKSDDPNPPGAVVPHSADISLDPAGPYADGQVVTLSVPAGFAMDLINGGARLCAVLADGPEGPGEWCDPADTTVFGSATATTVDVRLSRLVFTPTGDRDCEDPAVTCRLVVRSANGGDGSDVASGVLRFAGDRPGRSASIELAGTGTPGVVTLSTDSIEPNQSWLDLRSSSPEQAAGFEPFWVSVCAFGEPEAPKDPWGTSRWLTSGGQVTAPTPNCDVYDPIATIEPDAPSGPVQAVVPRWFLGYSGWNDCRVDLCFVGITRRIVYGKAPGSGLYGGDELAAARLIPAPLVDPEGARPALRVITPGPHLAGQELTVEVTGLSSGRSTSIGVCQAGDEWGCGYLAASMDQVDNGTHVIQLPQQFSCPDRCYLELDSQGEGMPPLATAALDAGG